MEPSPEREDPLAPPTPREALVPAMAVAAVAIVALTAAVVVKRSDDARAPAVAQQQRAAPVADANVVKAPPLKAPDTNAMGGAPACKDCGVVQMVVAMFDRGGTEPRAYQMHVRMDDGSVRTVVQRGALAAGSRVVVDGNSVKPMSS